MNVRHITIVSSGSRGDVQPYIAFGLGLQRAGFRVRLVCAENFAEFVTRYGLEFCPGSEDAEAVLRSPETQRTMQRHSNPLKVFSLLMQGMTQALKRQVSRQWAACQGTDAIIGHFIDSWIVQPIAEFLNVPFIDSGVVPNTPTSAFPNPYFPAQRLGWPVYHRLTHWLIFRMSWSLMHPIIEKEQRKLFSRPAAAAGQETGGQETGGKPAKVLTLYGFSPAFLQKPPDWGAHVYLTGYWFLDEPAGPDPNLRRFVEAGEPPIYVGFGSMPSADPRRMSALVVEALQKTGQRGVLLSGWNGLDREGLPESIYIADQLPHAWLFPRCKAVIHHGGAGTTGAGLRTGVPSIIVPFAGDQGFWAQRVYEKGIGPQPVPRHRLTAERLAGAIEKALRDRELQRKAWELGEKVRAEDGVARAVELVVRKF